MVMVTYIYPPPSYRQAIYLQAQKERPRQTTEGEVFGFTKRQLELVMKLVEAVMVPRNRYVLLLDPA